MTKKEIASLVETLVQDIARAHGAQIVTKQQKVGGRVTDVQVADGGLFDLDACRRLLGRALVAKREELVGFFAATQPVAAKAAYDLAADKVPVS